MTRYIHSNVYNNVRYKFNNILKIISDVLFYFTLFIFLINTIISWFLVEKFSLIYSLLLWTNNYVMKYSVYVLFLCILLKKNKIIKFPFFILLFLWISYKSYLMSENITIFITFLMVVASIDIKYNSIIKFCTFIKLPICFLTILLSLIGVIENYIAPNDIRNRAYLGYTWTTTSAITFLFITFSIILIKNGKMSIFHYIILYFVNIWLFIQTNTRFCFLIAMSVLTFFLLMGDKFDYIFKKITIKVICISLPWICAMVTFLLVYMYGKKLVVADKLDFLLNTRLRLGLSAFRTYGFTLFGQNIRWIGGSAFNTGTEVYNYVDSAYLQTFFSYGLITLLAFLILFSFIIYRAFKANNYTLASIMVFICVFAITEPQLCWLQYNSFMLLCFADLKTTEKSVKKVKYKWHHGFIKYAISLK